MKFQQLVYHLEAYGCTVDPLIEEGYLASNCINGHVCVVEKLRVYTVPTLCHYFYELGVPAPDFLRDEYDKYRDLRDELAETVKVPKTQG